MFFFSFSLTSELQQFTVLRYNIFPLSLTVRLISEQQCNETFDLRDLLRKSRLKLKV